MERGDHGLDIDDERESSKVSNVLKLGLHHIPQSDYDARHEENLPPTWRAEVFKITRKEKGQKRFGTNKVSRTGLKYLSIP